MNYVHGQPYHECHCLLKVHDLQDECGQDVEALAVARGLIEPGVGQEHPLQHRMLLLAAESCCPCAVEILGGREGGREERREGGGGEGGREGSRRGGRTRYNICILNSSVI